MNWIWHLCMANMKKKGIRTFLTVLGVAIGVVSIVSLLSVGMGVKNTLVGDITESESITQIRVLSNNESKRKDHMLTDRKMSEFQELDNVVVVYPVLCLEGSSSYEHYTGYGSILGVSKEYLAKRNLVFGEYPNNRGIKPELIMGQGALYTYYRNNTDTSYLESIDEEKRKEIDLTGEKLQVQLGYDSEEKHPMKIVGMLDENCFDTYCDIEILKRFLKKNAVDGSIVGQPKDKNGDSYNEWIYTEAIVEVDDIDHVDGVNKRLKDMGFQTINDKEYLESAQKTMKIVQILLGGIGMIALVVAVIGIGNTMTTSVYDRITEIGILKVLGCDPSEMIYLFLLEAGILGGIGGIIGIVGSVLITQVGVNCIATKMLQLDKGTHLAVMPIWLVVGAFVFSVALGVIAGWLPAKWASQMRPIEAVQHR